MKTGLCSAASLIPIFGSCIITLPPLAFETCGMEFGDDEKLDNKLRDDIDRVPEK